MKLHRSLDVTVLDLLDERDHVVYEKRLPNHLPVILTQLAPYRDQIEGLAVESTCNWYWLVDGLMEAGYRVHLVNTAAVKVYEGLKYTADEHDARHLAHLLRLGILPTGYIYPKEERAVRDLLRKRSQLVRCRTMQILSVQNLVSRNTGQRVAIDWVRALSPKALKVLCGDDRRALAIQTNLAVLQRLDEQIETLERTVLAQARLKPSFETLLTVRGVGPILGMTIMYETGAIERFPQAGHYASYCRCVDAGRWSNAKKKGEGNRKNGNKYLAWAYVEAAHFAVRYNERIQRFFQRKKAKTNGILAIKAVAHKLSRACFHMLKEQTPFNVERAFA